MKYSIKKLFVVYVLFCIPSFLVAGIWPRKMIISVPVADMRHTPEVAKKLTYEKMDWKQTSQLLFGDRVLAFEEKKGWLRVHAIDQEVFVKNKWYPCSGWIKANQARWVKRFPEYNLVVNKPFARIKISKKRSVILSLGTKLYGERLIKGSRLSLKDKVGS